MPKNGSNLYSLKFPPPEKNIVTGWLRTCLIVVTGYCMSICQKSLLVAKCSDGRSTHSFGLWFQSRRLLGRHLPVRTLRRAALWCLNVAHMGHPDPQPTGCLMVNQSLMDSSYQLEVLSRIMITFSIIIIFIDHAKNNKQTNKQGDQMLH